MNRMSERVEWLRCIHAELLPKAMLSYQGTEEDFTELLRALYWASYGPQEAIDFISRLFKCPETKKIQWDFLVGYADECWSNAAKEIEMRQ